MSGDKRRKPPSEPPDQNQRDLILSELNRNILVEAAAGTGKTTCIVGRMVALLRTGTCPQIRNLAAVTFTRKAAAELRGRFRIALEKAAREMDGAEQQRLKSALAHVEQCYVGTIHSFCGRLLRERPVEAELDPAFTEIEEDADARLRGEAWNEFVARTLADPSNGLVADLAAYGLRLSDLADTFLSFCNYPDVQEWPVPKRDEAPPDIAATRKEMESYLRHMTELKPLLPEDAGNDKLIPNYRRLPRIVPHYGSLDRLPNLMEALAHFNHSATQIQKEWMKTGHFTRDKAKAEKGRWDTFREERVTPLFQYWYESRYEPILRTLHEARRTYDQFRRERGLLNFQDLLMKAAELLRNAPHVRRYFRERFTHLLVDEFQDTDPIQAEVLLLLASEDSRETDWRRCRPRPGSLFVVGDPKQSIYRFRRADIVTYNEVKDIVAGSGDGMLVTLSANFRATADIVDWVNGTFGPKHEEGGESSGVQLRFAGESSEESPAYVDLQVGRNVGETGQLQGIFSLTGPDGLEKEEIVEYEADRIARTIRHAVDAGLTIARTRRQLEEGVLPQARFSDFLIIAYAKKDLSRYADKLQEYGIPHQVTGGSALNEVDELALLHFCVQAVVHPDNPVFLVGALRSELFGVSDAVLYRFKKAGGRFSYNATVPKELGAEDAALFQDAYGWLKRYALWFSKLPPVVAFERIVADLGLMVRAGVAPGGDVRAGSVAKTVEILRGIQNEAWTVAKLVEHLGRLVELETRYDGISARSEDPPAVRVMNLHKVKGLEAPVVFLANPFGDTGHPVGLHVDRSGVAVVGYMAVAKPNGWQSVPVAQPAGWSVFEERERRFLAAEALRLRYVAATRAGSALIVTQCAKNSKNPWRHFAPYIPADQELPDPGPVEKTMFEPEPSSEDTPRDALDAISKRIKQAIEPTYDVQAAKEFALAQTRGKISALSADVESPNAPRADEGEHGVEWGSVIHALLAMGMAQPDSDLVKEAEALLSENGLEAGLAANAAQVAKSVMASDIWRRAGASKRRLVEVPFQSLLGPDPDRPIPTVLRGAIDLVFEEPDGWVIVDYKTDRVDKKSLAALVATYKPQLELYATCWEICAGVAVKEAGLFFTDTGTYQLVR